MSQAGDTKEADARASVATTTSRIAFGSCHKSSKSAVPPIWDTILPPLPDAGREIDSEIESASFRSDSDPNSDSKLDAWLWLGDAMYPSHRDLVTNKKYYGPAPPEEVEAGLRAMKHENATIGYKGFLERLNRYYHENDKGGSSEHRSGGGPLVTGIWDDHDFGGNDMGSSMPEKKRRQRIYRSFLGTRATTDESSGDVANRGEDSLQGGSGSETETETETETRDGMYHRVDLEGGKIRVLALDTRWFREDHCVPSVAHRIPMGNAVACLTRWMTSGLLLERFAWMWGKGDCRNAGILGDEQWQWLENELLVESSREAASADPRRHHHPPELFVILSSIQVWSTNPIMEGWGHFPTEQERLWNLLRTHYGNNNKNNGNGNDPIDPPLPLPPAPVLFLSGDVHHGEISGGPGYYEITSSGLTHHCGQHKLYGSVCEPVLRTFSDHRSGVRGEGRQNDNDGGGEGEGESYSDKDKDKDKDHDHRDRYFIGLNYGVLEVVTTTSDSDSDSDSDDHHHRHPKREVRAQIRNATGHTVLEVTQALAGHGPVPVLPPYSELPRVWDGHLIPYARGALLLAAVGLASIRAVLLGRTR